MSYLPNIPGPGDAISQSQVDIQNNFQKLNVGFGVDHVQYDQTNAGTHKVINFLSLPAAPVPSGTNSGLYPAAVTGITQLFFKNATTTTQLTGLPNDIVGAGTITLAAGLILKWGFAPAGGYNPVVAFATAFPANCFNVQLTAQLNDTTAKSFAVKDGTLLKTGFTIQASAYTAYTGVYWFAIGN